MSTADGKKITRNSLKSDLVTALSIVLRIGLFIFLFGAVSTNNDVNAILKLYLLGFLALVSIGHFLLTRSCRQYLQKSNRLVAVGLTIFILLSLITFWTTFSPSNSLLGGEGYRLGYLTLIGAMIVGVSAKYIIDHKSLVWYYIGTLVMLSASVVFSVVVIHLDGRLAWPILLSNNLALMLSAAFMIGIYIICRSNWRIIIVGQIFLLTGIGMTQSRAVLVLTIIIGGIYFFGRYGKTLSQKSLRRYFLSAAVIAIIFLLFAPWRLKSPQYLGSSAIYRLELQKRGLEMVAIRPLTGLGPDAIKYYFNLGSSYGPHITETMKSGYKFMSVHNIYLDKLIEYGLLAGLFFCGLTVRALKRGSHLDEPLSVVVMVIFGLICLYGLVDFFSIETMVLFWLGLNYLNISSLTVSDE